MQKVKRAPSSGSLGPGPDPPCKAWAKRFTPCNSIFSRAGPSSSSVSPVLPLSSSFLFGPPGRMYTRSAVTVQQSTRCFSSLSVDPLQTAFVGCSAAGADGAPPKRWGRGNPALPPAEGPEGHRRPRPKPQEKEYLHSRCFRSLVASDRQKPWDSAAPVAQRDSTCWSSGC